MTYRPASVPPGAVPAPAIEARLEPDAIGAVQDTVTGMASSAPAGTMAATLAAASAYGFGPVLVLTALPMLVIANSCRRLNLWSANCGASFEWAGRAINPYLGFITGWLMIAGYVIGTVAVRVLPDPAGKRLQGTVMNKPAPPGPASQHDVPTCLVCGMTGPSPDSACRPGRDHRVSPPEAGCPGCGRLTAVCARRFPCQARRSRFGWRLVRLRLRRGWRRLRPGPPCCGTPGGARGYDVRARYQRAEHGAGL